MHAMHWIQGGVLRDREFIAVKFMHDMGITPTRNHRVDYGRWDSGPSEIVRPRRNFALPSVHGSEAGLLLMAMNGNPDEILRDLGNRILELERLAVVSDQRERLLRNRLEELNRSAGGGARGIMQ